MLRVHRFALPALAVVLLPTLAYAQGSITGTVRDSSGGVLPGVIVEAASPVLIEKVRSVVTDATGQYRIVDLRPGSYAVTFTLTGFSSVRQEGIELTGSFTATVNAEMRVGTLAETITVSAESPIVDVQNVTQQRVFTDTVLQPLNRLATKRLLRESRRKVWANAVALSASRRAGGADGAEHQRQLAELEELSAARVADLMRPGPVLLRLAAGGFGVQLKDH